MTRLSLSVAEPTRDILRAEISINNRQVDSGVNAPIGWGTSIVPTG